MGRRLAAILAADVAGYSRLMGDDQAGTLRALRQVRTEVFTQTVNHHQGEIVKSMGDGWLVEFSSLTDAITCAIAIQERLAEHDSIQLRVGVHLGDVTREDEDIFGDGVNIAARLQEMSQPGGIVISDFAQRSIDRKLAADFINLGTQNLKNIAEPITAYGWGMTEIAAKPADVSSSEKPSLAVLPFDNLSGDPEQEYFADGMSEDIITGLSRNPDLFVISRNSTFGYKGKIIGVRDVGSELGAKFVLKGSVRKGGQRIRVTAQLVDVATDNHLWAERFDRDLDDVFTVQDEVVGSILHALGAADGVLEKAARKRRASISTNDLTAYDCFLQARDHFYQHGDGGFDVAEALYEKAISLDAGYARAYSALAWLHFVRFKLFRTKRFDEIQSKALDLAQRALRLDPSDFRAHWVLGGLYLHEGKHSQCLAEFDKALRANPNDANLLAWSAEALVYCERTTEAVERCERAIHLNPNCPDWYYWIMGSALFHGGRYEEALAVMQKMSAPEHARRLKAATYAQLGQIEEAQSEAKEFLKAVPGFSIGTWAETEHYTDPKELKRYVDGMRKAGLPE